MQLLIEGGQLLALIAQGFDVGREHEHALALVARILREDAGEAADEQ